MSQSSGEASQNEDDKQYQRHSEAAAKLELHSFLSNQRLGHGLDFGEHFDLMGGFGEDSSRLSTTTRVSHWSNDNFEHLRSESLSTPFPHPLPSDSYTARTEGPPTPAPTPQLLPQASFSPNISTNMVPPSLEQMERYAAKMVFQMNPKLAMLASALQDYHMAVPSIDQFADLSSSTFGANNLLDLSLRLVASYKEDIARHDVLKEEFLQQVRERLASINSRLLQAVPIQSKLPASVSDSLPPLPPNLPHIPFSDHSNTPLPTNKASQVLNNDNAAIKVKDCSMADWRP